MKVFVHIIQKTRKILVLWEVFNINQWLGFYPQIFKKSSAIIMEEEQLYFINETGLWKIIA